MKAGKPRYDFKKSMEKLLDILSKKMIYSQFDCNLNRPVLTKEEVTQIINAGVETTYKRKTTPGKVPRLNLRPDPKLISINRGEP